ncbi:zf-DHHC-domain-containing protein [Xylariaceae sp. FL0662B]|nr:zf-DHHC-domain-containing protein [Xylariaceae sp. FL0662B]
MAFLIGSTAPALQNLAVPAVCVLIAFLAYTSQWLFANAPDLAPGPLTASETYIFNALVLCLWYTYYKACTVDPGRYVFPSHSKKTDDTDRAPAAPDPRGRWCRKCAAPKPPRAHHCKTCRRCIPKMDHHCPWTSNCVSLQTFPHFLRFLTYANLSLWTLLYFLFARFRGLWDARNLPAYLGPTLHQLALLTVLAFATGVTALALGVMLATTLQAWAFNTTMIESWEISRHEAALERRDGADDAWWSAPAEDRLRLEPVEFPYDVGVFANMAQAIGTSNPLLWFWPFAGGPTVAPWRPLRDFDPNFDSDGRSSNADATALQGVGWTYEENGLNDREGMWPPPDPDKLRHDRAWRGRRRSAERRRRAEFEQEHASTSPEEQRDAFRRRQARDLRRWEQHGSVLRELEEEVEDYDFVDEAYDHHNAPSASSYPYDPDRPMTTGVDDGGGSRQHPASGGWVNADGEKLGDFGVDEEAEGSDGARLFDGDEGREEEDEDEDEEDIPLAELIRRRRVLTRDGGEDT